MLAVVVTVCRGHGGERGACLRNSPFLSCRPIVPAPLGQTQACTETKLTAAVCVASNLTERQRTKGVFAAVNTVAVCLGFSVGLTDQELEGKLHDDRVYCRSIMHDAPECLLTN